MRTHKKVKISCGSFVEQQGIIQALLFCLICIGIPFFLCSTVGASVINEIIDDITSSFLITVLFIIMISAPILSLFVAIYAKIRSYYVFIKNPENIKSITMTEDEMKFNCIKRSYNKILKYNEIAYVDINCKSMTVRNPRQIAHEYKLFGTFFSIHNSSEYIYELDVVIVDKQKHKYNITIPSKFSIDPYSPFKNFKKLLINANVKLKGDVELI